MPLKDFARRLPDDVWERLEPILPPVIWCGKGRKPKPNRDCFHALLYVLHGYPVGDATGGVSVLQNRATAVAAVAGTGPFP